MIILPQTQKRILRCLLGQLMASQDPEAAVVDLFAIGQIYLCEFLGAHSISPPSGIGGVGLGGWLGGALQKITRANSTVASVRMRHKIAKMLKSG